MDTINALLANPVNILAWIIFGFIAGFIVHLIDPTDVRGGIIGTVILGIVGAIIGGFISSAVLGTTIIGFSIQGLVAAVVGGLILAIIARLLFAAGRGATPRGFRPT
ncbi:GlsB/YeaQ/YmgE family stress response membrane protein [Patescibacteria group bacterium]|nr:GlsB/YeaQ/YmgE family stress response membrane protein [Patescibacteria group bacterium]